MEKRKQYNPSEKVSILRRHLIDQVPVSDLCDEYQLQPSVVYEWQRRLMDNAAVALEPDRADKVSKGRERQLEDKVGRLEAKLAKKDTVMAELLAGYVALKNAGGEP